MPVLKQIKQSNKLRWFFLGIGLVAVVALTGMNVYSLYALRQSTIDSAKDHKKNQLEEFTHQVRYRFTRVPWAISKLDVQQITNLWETSRTIPSGLKDVLAEVDRDSLFQEIYFIPPEVENCYNNPDDIYKFDPFTKTFKTETEIPDTICDGFGISSSQLKALIGDLRWSTKTTFDAHRSMTVALINQNDRSIEGHLGFLIDRNYLVNRYLEPEIRSLFGPSEESGLVVWLRDWMQDEILTTSDPEHTGTYHGEQGEQVDIRQHFPGDLLDNWQLQASFLESPTVAASNASLTRNLIVLVFAVFVLFGALVFMFINAQRERELAQRQAGFLANITHELKTPLAVMQAAGENISDGRVTEGKRLRSYGDHIYNESVRLRTMIEKLLDVAKVDSGQSVVEQAPHHLNLLLQKYYETNIQYLNNKGFDVKLEMEEDVPLAMIDPDHLDTMLNNLVENAVKYSRDEKEIVISLRSHSDKIYLSISDKGPGIPKKAQKHIFDKFYRVENSLTAKTKGHGLGLAIVKNIVEMNGGTIEVESVPDKGSVFTVIFPAFLKKSGDSQKASRHSPKPVQPNRIEADEYAQ